MSRRMRGGQTIPGQVPGQVPSQVSGQVPDQVPPVDPDAERGMFDTIGSKLDEGVNKFENTLGNGVTEIKEKSTKMFNQVTGNTEGNTEGNPQATTNKGIFDFFNGGRRSSRQMKGGLSPAFGYNAAPVTDSVTAQPTYMMKYNGGRRRKTCKRRTCKRRTCKRKSCKGKNCRKHR